MSRASPRCSISRAHETGLRLKVLFVCLGNICRSPTAEGVLREIAAREAPQLITQVDSAGTADYHVGEPPDRRSIATAARRGYDISTLRARQVTASDFSHFDLLLAMDRSNVDALARIAPRGGMARVSLCMGFAPSAAAIEVPDPYYGGPADFERVVDLCELAARGLLRAQQR